jgi:hypothetical protein
MSARQAETYPTDTLAKLREFLSADSGASPRMAQEDRAKVKDLGADVRRLARSEWFPGAPGFGRVFSGFEWIFSIWVQPARRRRGLEALGSAAMNGARPRAFVGDYSVFDRLSIVYGGLFRGSVVINYLLGVVGVGFAVCSILPQPRFVSPSGQLLFPEFAYYGAWIDFFCILVISVIFGYGHTPDYETWPKQPRLRRRWTLRAFAHRWHERWLEYRVLAERFRYLELILLVSPGAAGEPPFTPEKPADRRWYDRYFLSRTQEAKPTRISVREFREWALALMLEQIGHHDANSSRRGAIGRRLHKFAVLLFFVSLVLCLVDLAAESEALRCATQLRGFILPCNWTEYFTENFRSLVLFGAVMAPVLGAAIHGVLTTTEYTKVAESSRETGDRIASLLVPIRALPPSEADASLVTLEPIRDAVIAFADAAINEASGWHAMLRDKNVPLV